MSAETKKYVCKCGAAYACASGLSRHKSTAHSTKAKPTCEVCGKAFGNKEYLDRHRLVVHEKPCDHKCAECPAAFSTRGKLKRHQLIHTDERPYACNDCGASFRNAEHLKGHILYKHSEERSYPCDQCEKRFFTQGDLFEHRRRHSDEKPHQCAECSATFYRSSELRQHVRFCHSKEKRHECIECDAKFVTAGQLSVHVMRWHSKERPHVCDKCEHAFVTSGELNMHVRRNHSKERPYSCLLCPYRFTTGQELKSHSRVHTGERPYVCTQCSSRFSSVGQRSVHVKRMHTDKRPYRCDQCTAAFVTPGELRYHTRSQHTGERPFRCNVCEKGFFSSSLLYRHAQEVHLGSCRTCLEARQSAATAPFVHRNFAADKLCYACGVFKYGEEAAWRVEHRLAAYLQREFGDHEDVAAIVLDRVAPNAEGCTRRRPDVLLLTSQGTAVVECDEHQHRTHPYSCEAKVVKERWTELQNVNLDARRKLSEDARMSEIAMTGDVEPIVFWRINPDLYHNQEDAAVPISEAERFQALRDDIAGWLDGSWEAEHFIQVVYWFYNGAQRQEDFVPVDGEEYNTWLGQFNSDE